MFGSLFVLDAPPQDRWLLWAKLFATPCYFAVFIGLQLLGLFQHQRRFYFLAFLLSVLVLTVAVITKDYFLSCENLTCEDLINCLFCLGFSGSVPILGCLSLYIGLKSRTQRT